MPIRGHGKYMGGRAIGGIVERKVAKDDVVKQRGKKEGISGNCKKKKHHNCYQVLCTCPCHSDVLPK